MPVHTKAEKAKNRKRATKRTMPRRKAATKTSRKRR